MPEGEEQKEIENLFEQIMKEHFSNLTKEIRLSASPRSPESPKEVGPKEEHTKAIIIKLRKIKDKERNLKAARGKERVTYKGVPIRLSADFSKGTLQARRSWEEVLIQSHERQGPTSNITLSSEAII